MSWGAVLGVLSLLPGAHRVSLPPTPYFDGEAEDLDTHAANIRGCHFPHQLGKLVSVLINLLHSQSP